MYDENSNNASSASAATAAAVAAAAAAANQSTVNGNVTAAVVSPVNPSGTPTVVPQVGANPTLNQIFTAKDPRWLQLEVCREFQRGQCSRSNLECKYAHPPPHVDVQNGRVTACYDSIKGRCTRENPKCKYLHPPQHLKDQLLINGRQSLALKSLICSQLSQQQQAQAHPAMAPVNLAQLVHPQQQLIQAMPYQYYPGLTAVYPTLMQAPPQATADPYQVQTPLHFAQLAALLQQQQQQQLASATGLQSAASPVALAAAAAAYQQQQAAAVAAAAAASGVSVSAASVTSASRKRTHGDDDVTPSTSTAAEAAAAAAVAANPLLLAAVANGGVPCKRPTMDKNGASTQPAAVNAANLALYTQQQYNPYLVPSLHGYVPAVSFSGQLPPPRY